MADGLDAGTCFVNTYNKTDVAAPFGGFKQSGYGKDLGKANSKPFMLQTKSGLNLREVMSMIIVVISLVQDGHHLTNNIYIYIYIFDEINFPSSFTHWSLFIVFITMTMNSNFLELKESNFWGGGGVGWGRVNYCLKKFEVTDQ